MARTKQSVREEGRQAFEEPEPRADPRRSKAKAKPKPKPTAKPEGVTKNKTKAAKGSCYVVSSMEDAHYNNPSLFNVDSVHNTLEAANKRARDLFFKKNPWGISAEDIKGMGVSEHKDSAGSLTFHVEPPDSDTWEVKVHEVPAPK